MGWEIKTLQKAKETLKHDVEKLEKEIVTLESQKKSVRYRNEIYEIFFIQFLNRLKMLMQ